MADLREECESCHDRRGRVIRRSSWPVIVVACLLAVALAFHRLWTNPLPESRDALLSELDHDRVVASRNPTSFRAQHRLADVLVRLGQAPDAETPARRAVALAPNDASAHATLGVVLAAENEGEQALGELGFAVSHGDHDRLTYRMLAWAYASTHQDSAANRAYLDALSRYSSDRAMLDGYARFLIRSHRPGAIEFAKRGVSVAPRSADAHATLAMAYFHEVDVQRARDEMRAATQLDSTSWRYWGDFGIYSWASGDTVGAWTALSRARAIDSTRVDLEPGWHSVWKAVSAAHR
jgi:Flp pilus assembly protein TadD